VVGLHPLLNIYVPRREVAALAFHLVSIIIFDTISKFDSFILYKLMLPLNRLVLGFKLSDLLISVIALSLQIFSLICFVFGTFEALNKDLLFLIISVD
jgi:hypothetical protein